MKDSKKSLKDLVKEQADTSTVKGGRSVTSEPTDERNSGDSRLVNDAKKFFEGNEDANRLYNDKFGSTERTK
jgi:hypothetical protein